MRKKVTKMEMVEMLTRGHSGSLEMLLQVLNADFLWLRKKRGEGRANILQRSGTGTWEMCFLTSHRLVLTHSQFK